MYPIGTRFLGVVAWPDLGLGIITYTQNVTWLDKQNCGTV